MFKNPAEKLKKVAKILFALSVLSAVILAFSLGFVEEEIGYYYTYTDTVFYAGRFFGVLFGIPLVSYVQCLCLYGLGELIENSAKAKKKIDSSIGNETANRELVDDIESNLPEM